MYRDWLLYNFSTTSWTFMYFAGRNHAFFSHQESLFLVYILNAGWCLLVAAKRQTDGVLYPNHDLDLSPYHWLGHNDVLSSPGLHQLPPFCALVFSNECLQSCWQVRLLYTSKVKLLEKLKMVRRSLLFSFSCWNLMKQRWMY